MLIEALTESLSGSPLFWTMLLAIGIDLLLGDPPWLYRVIPHPVVLMGRFIAWGEARLNHHDASASRRRRAGLYMTILSVTLVFAVGAGLHWLCLQGPWGWVVEAILASSLVAFRSLNEHVRAVARALEASLDEGREEVAKIVGRDPERLDEAGVARAAAESLAENFSDGVVAPLFWFALLGLPGLCAYKMINTLDSMIGYRNERYLDFGRAAARLDDLVNWLPARLAGGLFVFAAVLYPWASAKGAWISMCRDAPKHRSPNAGWQEAALAGALGIALAGPRQYPTETVEDPWMGDGRADLNSRDLDEALKMYWIAGGLIAVSILVGALLTLP